MNKTINYGFKRNGLINGVPAPSIDGKYGNYTSLQEACVQIPIEERAIGLTVGIEDINGSISEYWWKRGIGDNDLEAKNDFDYIQEQIDELNYKVDHIVPVGPGGIEIIVGDTLLYDEDTKYLNVKNPLPETVYLSGSVFKIENDLTVSEYKSISLGSNIVINGSGINIKNKINITEYGLSGSNITFGGTNVIISGQYIALSGNESNLFGSTIAIGDSNTEAISISGSSISIGDAVYISGSFMLLNKIINSDFIVQNDDTSGIISLITNEITLSGSNIYLKGNTFISGSTYISENAFISGSVYIYNNLSVSNSGSIFLNSTDINLSGSNINLSGSVNIYNNIKFGESITGSRSYIEKTINNITLKHGEGGSIDLYGTNIHIGNNNGTTDRNINLYGNINLGGELATGFNGSITLGFTGGGTGNIYLRLGSNLYKFSGNGSYGSFVAVT